MEKNQARYKAGYGHSVRETPSFRVKDYDFVDKLPLATTPYRTADALAKKSYNNLQRRTSGPCRILEVRAATIVVDAHGIQNTISVDCPTHAPTVQDAGATYKTSHDERQTLNAQRPAATPAMPINKRQARTLPRRNQLNQTGSNPTIVRKNKK